MLHNLGSLWTAYVVLALGALSALFLVWKSERPIERFVGFMGLGPVPLLAYSVLFGANEEQFYDFLFAPGLICLAIAVWTRRDRMVPLARAAFVVLFAVAVLADGATYFKVHTSNNDSAYQLDQWMTAHVPDGTAVAVTDPVQRELFVRYEMIDDVNDAPLDAQARYLVVFAKEIDQGYGFVSKDTISAQTRGLKVVYSGGDAENGRVAVYAID